MLMSSGMDFPNSSVNAPAKKNHAVAPKKVTKKVTQQAASTINQYIQIAAQNNDI